MFKCLKSCDILFVISLLCLTMSCHKGDGPNATIKEPTELSANSEMTRFVKLIWKDNSSNEDGFVVERKDSLSSFVKIVELPANTTSYIDTNIKHLTRYTFRVCAFRKNDPLSYCSNQVDYKYQIDLNLNLLSVDNVTETSVLATGSLSDSTNKVVLEKGFLIGLLPNLLYENSRRIASDTNSLVFRKTIDSLGPNTQYYIRAFARNVSGIYYSAEKTFATNSAKQISGLIAYYPFNGNFNDESGFSNHASSNGVNFGNDRFGVTNRAIVISNSGQYLKTLKVIQLVQNSFTISFWAKSDSKDTLVSQGSTGSEKYAIRPVIHSSHGRNWGTQEANAGVGITFAINQITVIEHTHLFVASPLVYNPSSDLKGWHHIVIVYDQHIPSLYIDGVFIKKGLITNISVVRPSSGFDSVYPNSGFGASFSPNGLPTGQFLGSIDEISLYNRVLTIDEIKYLSKT